MSFYTYVGPVLEFELPLESKQVTEIKCSGNGSHKVKHTDAFCSKCGSKVVSNISTINSAMTYEDFIAKVDASISEEFYRANLTSKVSLIPANPGNLGLMLEAYDDEVSTEITPEVIARQLADFKNYASILTQELNHLGISYTISYRALAYYR